MKTKKVELEIKRDALGKIIIDFSRDKNSLFQRIKRAVRVRQVDPDVGVVWNDCPIEGCTNKVCLALNSDKCFLHTKGHRQWKLLKIWWKNLFR